jgi:hypothetical protein
MPGTAARKTHDFEHRYFGYWRPGAVCRVRVYEREDDVPVVLVSEPHENQNTSITNLMEQIAAELLSKLPVLRAAVEESARKDAAGVPFVLIEHYPRTKRELSWGIAESFSSVTFDSYEIERVYSHAMRSWNLPDPYRIRLGVPSWVHLTREEVVALIGEEPS